MPTYHLASCADDADLRITPHHPRPGPPDQHLQARADLRGAGAAPPEFAHLPLLIAPDGTKLSKRKHGPVVSVTTYRDAGFLPHAFVNFLCLLGWSPKDDREQMSRQELIDAFSFEGINRSNAVVNFTEEDPFDPKAIWLNAEHIRAHAGRRADRAAAAVLARRRVSTSSAASCCAVTPLIQERIKTAARRGRRSADFFFADELPPYDSAELIPQKGDAAHGAGRAGAGSAKCWPRPSSRHDGLDAALRAAAAALGVKAGQMFQPIRVAVCGRKNAPPLFETLEVLGRETCLKRIDQAIEKASRNDMSRLTIPTMPGDEARRHPTSSATSSSRT